MTEQELEKVALCIKSPLLISLKKQSDYIYNLQLQGNRRVWNVALDCSFGFPYRLPSVRLLDTSLIGSIPHVNFEGIICVEENDSILLDYTRPADLIIFFIEETVRVLDRSSLKIFQSKLTDEYEGYFQSTLPMINSFYSANNTAEIVNLRIAYQENFRLKKAQPILLYGNGGQLPRSFSNIKTLDECQVINIVHVPLTKPVLPPQNNESISFTYIKDILSNVSGGDQEKLQKILKKEKQSRTFFVLFSMPRTYGERTQILIRLSTGKSSEHPLISKKSSLNWEVKPYLLDRNNKTYLLERGGGENRLTNKKVSVIGCGSVGGEVVMMLAKAGVGEFTLIDYDTLNSDNIYRHRMGGSFLNYKPHKKTTRVKSRAKVSALNTLLEIDFPYIKVNPKFTTYENVLKDKDFINSDIVIVAVGSPTLSLKINKDLKALGITKAIFCWNEAAGVGGHSALFNFEECCFECLFSDSEGFKMNNYFSLIEPGQSISKNITGCAGVFTPFSYLDSSQTAILAAKECVSVLQENIHSRLLTWKGSVNGNIQLTERFHSICRLESTKLVRQKGCSACNAR